MLSVNREPFIYSFLIYIHLISFSCLIIVVSMWSTILEKTGCSGHTCIISDFRTVSSSFSQFRMMLAVDLSNLTFIMLRYISTIPTFSRTFIIKACWIFVKGFFVCLLRWSHYFKDHMYDSIYWVTYLLNLSCISEIKPTWPR